MALAMGSGDVISDVTVTLRVLRGEQQYELCSSRGRAPIRLLGSLLVMFAHDIHTKVHPFILALSLSHVHFPMQSISGHTNHKHTTDPCQLEKLISTRSTPV
jgi:hypothetical protein